MSCVSQYAAQQFCSPSTTNQGRGANLGGTLGLGKKSLKRNAEGGGSPTIISLGHSLVKQRKKRDGEESFRSKQGGVSRT